MVALRLEREVRGVLEWVVVPERELDNATVNTRTLAVCACETVEPCNATKKLAFNSSWALWSTVGFVEEDRTAGCAFVGHLCRT